MDHIDPFLLLDELGPVSYGPGEAVGAPDHPHRGFETVSYVLEGNREHRDSTGHSGRMGPGDVQWMTAGAGVIHAEMPAEQIRTLGGRVHGFQIWVNLPAKDKMVAPRYQYVPSTEIPVVEHDGIRVKVIAGKVDNVVGPIQTHSPIIYLHLTLAVGASFLQSLPASQNLFAYILSGSGTFGEGGTAAHSRQCPVFAHDGDAARIIAGGEGLDLLLLGGEPLYEPVARRGPFVMNTAAEVQQAFADYQSGRMGRIGA